jgi:hypothetical protein
MLITTVTAAGGPIADRHLPGTGADCLFAARAPAARLAAMTPSTDSNPEEYADDEYADHGEQPSTPADIPDDQPEADVLEQRQEVPYREDAW